MVARHMASGLTPRSLTRAAATIALLWFLYATAMPAWNRPSTDFPNYYTAASLARARQPLHRYYEWTWFQRQMDFAGIVSVSGEGQLGGYIPQTPLTMLPFVPLSILTPLAARKSLGDSEFPVPSELALADLEDDAVRDRRTLASGLPRIRCAPDEFPVGSILCFAAGVPYARGILRLQKARPGWWRAARSSVRAEIIWWSIAPSGHGKTPVAVGVRYGRYASAFGLLRRRMVRLERRGMVRNRGCSPSIGRRNPESLPSIERHGSHTASADIHHGG